MRVFASRFLETMSQDEIVTPEEWTWKPSSNEAYKIYATGRSTATRESTYSAEKDNRGDADRPNEGSLVA